MKFACHNILKPIVLLMMSFIFALSADATARSCDVLRSYKTGQELEYQTFTAKNKQVSTIRQEVRSVNLESGYLTVAMVQEVFDAKGKSINKGEYAILCRDGILQLDMSRLLPEESVKGMEGVEVRMDARRMQLPTEPLVGQMLPNAELALELGPEGANSLMTADMTVTGRKVLAQESITTPAGSFDTYLIEQKTSTRTKVLMIRKTFETTDRSWYDLSKGLLIKSESLDKKGKLTGYTVLSKFQNGV